MARGYALGALLLCGGCGVVAGLATDPLPDGGLGLPAGDGGRSVVEEPDAGATDAGPGRDGGGIDDAGSLDAGLVDAGATDAGPIDAGPSDAGLPGECGDGILQDGEVCDDGNLDDRDGCSRACTLWWDTSLDVRVRFSLTSPAEEPVAEVPVGLSLPLAWFPEWLPEGAQGVELCAVAADHRTVLPVEVERFAVGETVFVWTRLAELPAGESEIFLYLGDASLCPGEARDVWSSSYRAVWHLDGAEDSVAGRAVGGAGGNVSIVAEGARGSSARVSSAGWLAHQPIDDLWLTGDLTLEAWVRIDQLGSAQDYENTIFQAGGGDAPQAYFLNVENDGRLRAYWERGEGFGIISATSIESDESFALEPGDWHHVAMVRERSASRLRFYVDGRPLGEAEAYALQPNGTANASSFLYLGGNATSLQRALDGHLDEVRIAATAHADAWIAISHASTAGTLVTSAVRETH